MLILTRKVNEAVWIGDIPVRVCAVDGNRVKPGIEAPADIVISREGLIDRDSGRQYRDLDATMPEKWPPEGRAVSYTGEPGKLPRIGL